MKAVEVQGLSAAAWLAAELVYRKIVFSSRPVTLPLATRFEFYAPESWPQIESTLKSRAIEYSVVE